MLFKRAQIIHRKNRRRDPRAALDGNQRTRSNEQAKFVIKWLAETADQIVEIIKVSQDQVIDGQPRHREDPAKLSRDITRLTSLGVSQNPVAPASQILVVPLFHAYRSRHVLELAGDGLVWKADVHGAQHVDEARRRRVTVRTGA